MINKAVAARELRAAFYVVSDNKQLSVTRETIDFFVSAENVGKMQTDRMSKYKEMIELKLLLEDQFVNFGVQGRIKSLTSLLGKFMQGRSLLDMFGMKIITSTTEECYEVAEWLKSHYPIADFDDRIENPKFNGYRDLKLVARIADYFYVEFIIQSNQMYVDSHIKQPHSKAYPWKYHPAILTLPVQYREIKL